MNYSITFNGGRQVYCDAVAVLESPYQGKALLILAAPDGKLYAVDRPLIVLDPVRVEQIEPGMHRVAETIFHWKG